MGQSQDKLGRDFPLSRDKKNPCPIVPLSQEKGRSKNHIGIKDCQRNKKLSKNVFSSNMAIFSLFLLLSHVPAGPGQTVKIPARGNMSKSRPGLSHGKILSMSRCPFVPGQWGNFCLFLDCSVPLGTQIYLKFLPLPKPEQKRPPAATIFASLHKVFLDLDLNENSQISWPQCAFSSASHNIICNIPSIFIYFCRLRIAVCSALTMLGLGCWVLSLHLLKWTSR